MSKTFICYLHTLHSFTPELRVVACDTVELLPDMIRAELPTWGAFSVIDVYDDADRPLFRFSREGYEMQ